MTMTMILAVIVQDQTLGAALGAIFMIVMLALTALFFVFAIVWATDTGAFFAGRTIGGAKLWPRVSPKKTTKWLTRKSPAICPACRVRPTCPTLCRLCNHQRPLTC